MIEAGCIARKFTDGRKEKEGERVCLYVLIGNSAPCV